MEFARYIEGHPTYAGAAHCVDVVCDYPAPGETWVHIYIGGRWWVLCVAA